MKNETQLASPRHDARCPTLEEQAGFYDRWNSQFRAASFDDIGEESQARGLAVLESVRSLAIESPTILEVGCGTGWLTERLAQIARCTAIDLSPRAIDIAKQRGLSAEFIAGDFYTADLGSRRFDVVVCVETISYVPDQPLFVDKIGSITKPGGYLILTSVNSFVYKRRKDVRPPEPGQIRKWLSRRELHRLLKGHFRIVSSKTILPAGYSGVLRLVNSPKINRLLACVLSEAHLRAAKERLGFGHCRVIVARRRMTE